MKKRFITITLSLCMVLLVAAPATAFAGTKCTSANNNYAVKSFSDFGSMKNCGNLSELFNQYYKNCKPQKPGAGWENTVSKPSDCKGPACDQNGNQECTGNKCPNSDSNTGNSGNNNGSNNNNGNNNTNNGNNNTNNGNNNSNNNAGNIGSYEQQVANIVNQERAAAGLSPLKVNTNLSAVAEKKAEDMRDAGYFSHTSPTYGSPFDMMKQFGIKYQSAGENIAKGQKSPDSVMNAWMNSSGHKANILSTKYDQIGVGYVTDSKGTTYWVQMFMK